MFPGNQSHVAGHLLAIAEAGEIADGQQKGQPDQTVVRPYVELADVVAHDEDDISALELAHPGVTLRTMLSPANKANSILLFIRGIGTSFEISGAIATRPIEQLSWRPLRSESRGDSYRCSLRLCRGCQRCSENSTDRCKGTILRDALS